MSEQPTYLMIASMDVEPEFEDLFHEVYDTEHVPFLSQVPGVISVRRYQREELTMNIGGQRQTIHLENAHSTELRGGASQTFIESRLR
jgi:hypothetical protein